ncbi:MarR family transcriptional regulator [Streptantibioticus rubrisoli]|nr:MarR family transcriptional regulator [Streptantibioticus rubrisoli]
MLSLRGGFVGGGGRIRPDHAHPFGPISTSELAASEYMRTQSMAQTFPELEKGGLVQRTPDPRDGRRMLISA